MTTPKIAKEQNYSLRHGGWGHRLAPQEKKRYYLYNKMHIIYIYIFGISTKQEIKRFSAGQRAMQGTVLTVSAILMAVIVGVFVFVAANASRERMEYAPVQSTAYAIRSKFFWLLLISGVIVTVITMLDLPYAATRGDRIGATKEIAVDGRQWFLAVIGYRH